MPRDKGTAGAAAPKATMPGGVTAATASGEPELWQYLQVLYAAAPPGSLIEVRYRIRGSGMGRTFCPADSLDAVAAEITRLAPLTDVYVGVLSRRRHGGRRDDLAREAAVLWVDCDKPAAVAAMRTFTPSPSIIVESGSDEHRHAYWLLSSPVSLDVLEEANRRLSLALDADNAWDAARILRAPSTFNHKHDPPAEVRLERCDAARRSLADIFVAVGGDGQATPRRHRAPPRVSRPRSSRAPSTDWLVSRVPDEYVRLLTGIEVPRDRKIRCPSPSHEDRTASLHVYETAQAGWFCYGRDCRRGGGIYEFAAHVAGMNLPLRGADFLRVQEALLAIYERRMLL